MIRCRRAEVYLCTLYMYTTARIPATLAGEWKGETYTCPNACYNIAGQTFPCQDVKGSNKCYPPQGGVLDSAGREVCADGLFDCREKPVVNADHMCKLCKIGEGPCRNIADEYTCRAYVYDRIKPPVCPTGFRECRFETTTGTTTSATSTTTTSMSTTTASTTTTTTVRQCEYKTVAGSGPCVYELPGNNRTILRFEPAPGGGCLPGLFECRATTTSTTSTATATTTTTNAICSKPCTVGDYGDCRSNSADGADEVACGFADARQTGQCHSSNPVDCRPNKYTSSDIFPQQEGGRFSCSDCTGYTINGMVQSEDNKLVYARGSFGNCKHKVTGVCLPYNADGQCWPGTYDCAAAYTCTTPGAPVSGQCCACTASEAGPTAGPCQHPETGICLAMFAKSDGVYECLPGMNEC